MTGRIRDALLLCAGRGERMRALSPPLRDCPKPLLPYGEGVLVDAVLRRLREAGVERLVVNLHHQAERVEAHIRDHWDRELIFSHERDRLLGTGGGVRLAASFFGGRVFFVCNCDSLWEEADALRRMAEHFDAARMDVLLMLARRSYAEGYEGLGDFVMDGAGRLDFAEGVSDSFYGGVQLVCPEIFLSVGDDVFSARRVWDLARRRGRLFGWVLGGRWVHAGTVGGYGAARRMLR